MRDQTVTEAPNYLNACLVLLGVNFMWIFVLIWALFGFLSVLVVAAVINHAITRFAVWRRWQGAPPPSAFPN